MKRFFLCCWLLIGAASVSLLSCKDNPKQEEQTPDLSATLIPPLLPRTGKLAQAPEWPRTQEKVNELTNIANANPGDVRPRMRIVLIYLNEVRVTGNNYYYDAVQKMLNDILKIDPNNFEAKTFLSSVAMSLHQFQTAKDLATQAKAINPDNAYVYGVLVDANVELGNYAEAVSMSDKMQQIRPSLEAYSRASYLREIYGDYPGAIQAMQMAAQAGTAGSEAAEWARVQLGDLYLNTGKINEAEETYKSSLMARPEFPAAEMGLAKIARMRGNYDSAIMHTENAIRLVSESAYVSALGDLYELKGNQAKADEIRKDVVNLLEQSSKDQSKYATIKHNANREFANAYLAEKNYDKALQYALNDLKLRPDNIDANELVAWIYYLKGDYATAKPYADKTLITHTHNPTTLFKVASIYAKAGANEEASKLLAESKSVSPYIDPKVKMAVQ